MQQNFSQHSQIFQLRIVTSQFNMLIRIRNYRFSDLVFLGTKIRHCALGGRCSPASRCEEGSDCRMMLCREDKLTGHGDYLPGSVCCAPSSLSCPTLIEGTLPCSAQRRHRKTTFVMITQIDTKYLL